MTTVITMAVQIPESVPIADNFERSEKLANAVDVNLDGMFLNPRSNSNQGQNHMIIKIDTSNFSPNEYELDTESLVIHQIGTEEFWSVQLDGRRWYWINDSWRKKNAIKRWPMNPYWQNALTAINALFPQFSDEIDELMNHIYEDER